MSGHGTGEELGSFGRRGSGTGEGLGIDGSRRARQSAAVLHGASESWRPEIDDATRRRSSCDHVLSASSPASPVSGSN